MENNISSLVAYLAELRELGVPECHLPLDELKEHLPRRVSFTITVELERSSDHFFAVDLGYVVKGDSIPHLHYFEAKLFGRPFGGLQRSYRFDFNRARFSVLEARNLLLGRAVYKLFHGGEFNEQAVWLMLRREDGGSLAPFKPVIFRAEHRPALDRLLRIPAILEMEQAELAAELIRQVQLGNLLLVHVHEGSVVIRPKVLEFDPTRWLVKLHRYSDKTHLNPSHYIVNLSDEFQRNQRQ